MKLPIVHIHGGEVTEGAMDESIRHAITKMASLHFVAADAYAARVVQMGEQPNTVFQVGAPGLDLIQSMDYLSKSALEKALQLRLDSPVFLVTYHPVTWGQDSGREALESLFKALAFFPKATVIWTAANADSAGEELNKRIDDWSKKTALNVKVVTSLGSQGYLSVMKFADVVIGNSSSGIIEAPAMHVATVNIGDRQKGRLRSASIIDCNESKEQIQRAIEKAMSATFKKTIKDSKPAYGSGRSAKKMVEVLANYDFSESLSKPFYDLYLEGVQKHDATI